MYFQILSYRARYDREHNQTKCHNRNCTSIEVHMFEENIDDWHKNSNLRKSSSNQCPAQLVHSPKYLQGQLLDPSKHKARRKNHTKRQSSDEIRIRCICRKQVRDYDSDNIYYSHNNNSRTIEFSIFFLEFCMIRIIASVFYSSQTFNSQYIQS